ncbi:hypothetical protein V7112_08615 [Bacillus sp. JJ1566]|uniref:hypothetical protein n=1 Tax=Bacillus sp. JJ1566 TaxID=3122961 RepID=UPI002FFDC7D8
MKYIVYTILIYYFFITVVAMVGERSGKTLKRGFILFPLKITWVGFLIFITIGLPILGFRDFIDYQNNQEKKNNNHIFVEDDSNPTLNCAEDCGPGEGYPDYTEPDRYHMVDTDGDPNTVIDQYIRSNADHFESNNIDYEPYEYNNPFD